MLRALAGKGAREAPPPPKVPSGDSGGGGCCVMGIFADFGIFLGPIGGASSFCSKPSTFGRKIFFAQTAMSSKSSAPEVYQKNFFDLFGRVWMARSALARTAPCGQVWDTKSPKYPLLGAVWPCFDPCLLPTSCTSEPRETDGARGASGEKCETNRTRTIQM